jgi:hypothetical protein
MEKKRIEPRCLYGGKSIKYMKSMIVHLPSYMKIAENREKIIDDLLDGK